MSIELSAPQPITQAAPRLAALIEQAQQFAPLRTAIVHPCQQDALEGAIDATRAGLIEPVLVAPLAKLNKIANDCGLNLSSYEQHDVPHSHAAAEYAVTLAAQHRVDALMKGSLHTDELMATVLGTHGLADHLRTERRISHVFVIDVASYHKLLLITDGAINIAPDLDTKADILRNAIDLAQALGIAIPKAALLSAVETVNSKMIATIDAAALCKMSERGQIVGAILDGPLAFDNAISKAAARIKQIQSQVSGDADILLAPDLESGNILAKQLEYLSAAQTAGIVLGTRVPIMLSSRADPPAARRASAAIAQLYTQWCKQRV
ncbi:bifunctional enoyl-CoA hydratase/phosphate acetyltransferase [Ampullimonas aquatilis]|uniref:bifunctional enoyl-CoA hydratase/phosphate acetyltransferase n=1 Tax=Ampullimonas aquatilis TaxID=1341549 RepID=UPI003C70DC06